MNFKQITPTLLLFLCLFSLNIFAQKVSYTVGFEAPHTHYCEVEVKVTGNNKDFLDFKLPVWAPGSYLVREFAKNVEQENATDGSGKALKFGKITKSVWRVQTKGVKDVVFRYKVYAYEHSVRTSFIDASHGYLNGTSIFAYVEGLQNQALTLTVKPHKDWTKISTGMSSINNDPFQFEAPNYDVFVDSPLEIGNQKIYDFKALNIPHKIAVYGEGNYNEQTFTSDVAKIVEASTSIFGENPCKDYTFIVHNVHQGGGGLEHLNSTSLIRQRWGYNTKGGYLGWLGLVAHEYFHLWNVKRLRPEPLGPFDYQNENYTRQLWISEGFTSYYTHKILRKAGFNDDSEFVQNVQGDISYHENLQGSKVQSVAESSFDAWIKGYRPNENSSNSTISYYGSGSRIGAILDLIVINGSDAQYSLDDVMKEMYLEYYKKQNRAFTEVEFRKMVEKLAKTDLTEFFDKHIYGTEKLDYAKYLGYAGLSFGELPNRGTALGASLSEEGGKLVVKALNKGEAGYISGLNVNDEIIGVDGYRVSNSLLRSYLEQKRPSDKINVLISRDFKIQTLEITLTAPSSSTYSIFQGARPTEKQEKVYRKWTGM